MPKALGIIYTGSGIATAFAAPIGSYLGSIYGWRGVFLGLVPIALINLVWQWSSLPAMPPRAVNPVSKLLGLLKRRTVAYAMLGVMLTFAGAFTSFTYFRPFLETYTQVNVTQLSLLLLGLGASGFVGTYAAGALLRHHLYPLLRWLPLILAGLTMLLVAVRSELWPVAAALVLWGTINAAIPVTWSTWLSRGIKDEPESGGGLLIAAIQLSIMIGGFLGGVLLDHFSAVATLLGGSVLLPAL